MDRNTIWRSVESYDTTRNQRLIMYVLVGAIGVVINQSVLYLTTGVIGFSYAVGGFLGVTISITTNYAINDAWTWREHGARGWKPWAWRGLKYTGTRVAGIGVHMVALIVFVEFVGFHYLLANLLAIAVGFAWGFGASDVLVWKTTDAPYLEETGNRWRWLSEQIDRPTAYVLTFAALMFVFFTTFTILLYRGYWMTGGDFGSYVHAFETTRQGIGFMDTGRYRAGNPTNSYWGEHFSVTLFLAYPFYWLVPTQETLLVVKSFVLALSVPLLWFVAREHLSTRMAGMFVLLYGLNPFLHAAWLFDFQEQIFLPALLFGAYYCYRTERYHGFLVLVAAALLTNEFVVFVATGAIVGLAVAAHREPDRTLRDEWTVFAGAFMMAIATYLLAMYVTAQFNFFTGIPINSIAEPFRPHLETRRVGVVDLVLLLVREPILLWETLASNAVAKVGFLTLFLVPVAFLGIFDELTIGAFIPYLGFAWVFAGNEVYYTFAVHYPFYLLPFLYIGAVRVADGHLSISESRDLLTRIFVAVLVMSVLASVGGGLDRQAIPDEPTHADVLETSVEHVPEGATLVTQNDVYPHLADRPNTRYIASALLFREYEKMHGTKRPAYVLLSTEPLSGSGQWDAEVKKAFGDDFNEEYGLYRYEDGVWLFKRGYSGDPKGITDEYRPPSHAYTATDISADEGTLYDGKIESRVGVEDSTVWFGPYETLPPGTYDVTYQVNVSSSDEIPVARLEVVNESDQFAETAVNETGGWEDVTLTVTLEEVTDEIQFRGVREAENGSIAVRKVVVEPVD
ncbi:DUF2079 domain-containing protein [Natrinema gelatinilyticum]|uniref:DUF2079 domain-containing protein n=1 Tax=Natrinema gelatinilyticum TaxID=2961571 RepID=UPI0020C48F5D|nr:DUF2079 domain-containing protein [Natrinema gelatinilyticum]